MSDHTTEAAAPLLASAEPLVAEHASLERAMADPALHADQAALRRTTKRYAALGPVVAAYRALAAARADLAAAHELAGEDADFAAELPGIEATAAAAQERLHALLLPRDPDDDRDAFLEVKAGEGGEESALFAGDLLRMYLRYAERRGWRVELLDELVHARVPILGHVAEGVCPLDDVAFRVVREAQGALHEGVGGAALSVGGPSANRPASAPNPANPPAK